jgi:hypothetical protein
MDKAQKRQALEQLARNRTVKGWAFRDLTEEMRSSVLAFLDGGECPEGCERTYALCREQLKLPPVRYRLYFGDGDIFQDENGNTDFVVRKAKHWQAKLDDHVTVTLKEFTPE